jgi:hypothetical protein
MPCSTSASNQISMWAAGASVQCPAVKKTVAFSSVPLQRHKGRPDSSCATIKPT